MYHICFVYIYPHNGYWELKSFKEPCLTQVATITSFTRELNLMGVVEHIVIYRQTFSLYHNSLYIYIYICINTYICICIYKYIYTYICVCVCVCVCVVKTVWLYICMCGLLYDYIHVCVKYWRYINLLFSW